MRNWFVSILLLGSMLGGISFSVQAQERSVKGVVVADDGLPMPGVTVVVKGTSRGTITDIDGQYTLNVPEGAALEFSFIGYEDTTVPIGDKSQVDVALKEEVELLDAFEVIGYGARKKSDIIGSVSTVSSERLTEISSASLTEGLQGLSAGVHISSGGGGLGSSNSVRIRGLNSINASSNPLWIVDGVPIETSGTGQDPLTMINPGDIESMSILKDAEATAIYGSQGSAGVIIITTKSGKKGASSSNLSYKGGITTMGSSYEKIKIANTEEYFDIVNQARQNAGMSEADIDYLSTVLNVYMQEDDAGKYKRELYDTFPDALAVNTDWFDQILQVGGFHEFNFSTSGGFERGDYYVSAGYKQIEGVIKGNEFQSLNTRVNLNYQLFDHLKMGTKTSLSYTDNYKLQSNGYATFSSANFSALPWYKVHSDLNPSGYWNPMGGRNIVANADRDMYVNRLQNYRAISNYFFRFDVPWVKGWYFHSDLGFDHLNADDIAWESEYINRRGSYSRDEVRSRTTTMYNLYTNMNRDFLESHNIDATIGTETRMRSGRNRSMRASQLTTIYQQIGSHPGVMESMESTLSSEDYMRSYFGRASYKYRERYIAGISYRRDGSSKFQGDNRWSNFSAYSLGWLINREDFFTISDRLINVLKLRGSYGQTGNNSIDDAVFVDGWSTSTNYSYGPISDVPAGNNFTILGNSLVTWETTTSYDVGLDFSLMQNRFEGSIAYYYQDISDLLLKSPMPPSAAVDYYWDNIGDMSNSGLEFTISSVNMNKPLQKFKWSTDFNIASNHNQVEKLIENQDRIISGNKITMVGEELRTYYMPEYAGTYGVTVDYDFNQDGVANEQDMLGVEFIYAIDQDVWEDEGRIEYLTDENGERKILPATIENLDNNRVIHEGKSSIPSYYGGIGNRISYRGWDFNFRITFAGGHYLYDNLEQFMTNVNDGTKNLSNELLDNSWTYENQDAEYPTVIDNYQYPNVTQDAEGNWVGTKGQEGGWTSHTKNYSRYLYRGDYLRVKSLELGYNIPNRKLEKMSLTNMRVYFSATNLWTWAFFYEGWDPETGATTIPPYRTFNVGVNLGF